MFDNLDYLTQLDESAKARPCVLDNVERSLLCRTVYLGYDLFECPDCGKETIIPHSCHSRFCNSCGVKYAKQLAAKALTSCLDTTHRHIVFTIPKELRIVFKANRSLLDLLFVATRNTIAAITNPSFYKISKKLNLKNTHYLYKNYSHANHFGMIATLHTFGRALNWTLHIHCLVAEMVYDKDKDQLKKFHHFNFEKLRKIFQYELLRLLEEALGPSFKPLKSQIYKDHPKGFYVYARYKKDEDDEYSMKENSKNINACVSYCMRYASRPAMAENRIIEYNKEEGYVRWYYDDHKTNERQICKRQRERFY